MSDIRVPRKRATTRERLLDAAREVLADDGIQGASVEQICERAGYTRGAFYSNFADKDELVLAIFAREKDRIFDGLRVATGADGGGAAGEGAGEIAGGEIAGGEIAGGEAAGGGAAGGEAAGGEIAGGEIAGGGAQDLIATMIERFVRLSPSDRVAFLVHAEFVIHAIRHERVGADFREAWAEVKRDLAEVFHDVLARLGRRLVVAPEDAAITLIGVYDAFAREAVVEGRDLDAAALQRTFPRLITALTEPA